MDIPLVLDNVAASRAQTGNTPEAQKVADAMSDSLLAFARTGDPMLAGENRPALVAPAKTIGPAVAEQSRPAG